MKRKWRILIIIVAVLAFVLILIWPMAPLWRKLGLGLICIQGSGSDMKLVSCPDQEVVSVTPMPLPAPDASGPFPIIFDDDGSPDGMIALMYFLRNPRFDIRAVTISYGEAHPGLFVSHVAQILAAFGRANIPIGYGSEEPLGGTNAFPDSWRQDSDEFWKIPIPQVEGATVPVPAAALIADIVSESDKPVTIFVSGSHTNLAEALRLKPTISANIRDVFIMGGSVNAPGNIHSDWPEFDNELAEWNIWVDPLAAQEVFASDLVLHLVPLDATNQVVWTRNDLPGWESAGSPESALAADLLRVMLDAWSGNGVFIYDLAAAVQATLPAICPEVPLSLEIVTTPGVELGRTLIVDQSPNISVCLDPDPGRVKALSLSVFQQP